MTPLGVGRSPCHHPMVSASYRVIFAEIEGDRYVPPILAETLRKFADMLDKRQAGQNPAEFFNDDNGCKLKVIASNWTRELCPLEVRRFER